MGIKQISVSMEDFISDALKSKNTYNLNVINATQRDSQLTCGAVKVGDIIAITFMHHGYMYSVKADYLDDSAIVTRSDLYTDKVDKQYTFKCTLKR